MKCRPAPDINLDVKKSPYRFIQNPIPIGQKMFQLFEVKIQS